MNKQDSRIIEAISQSIRENSIQFFDEPAEIVSHFGDLDIDYWSVIATFFLITNTKKKFIIYCKFPKSDWSINRIGKINTDPKAKNMVMDEFVSLNFLYNYFSEKNVTPNVIRPLDFMQEFGAILTEGIEGCEEIYKLLWQAGKGKLRSDSVKNHLYLCGRWVAQLHSFRGGEHSFESKNKFHDQLAAFRAEIKRLTDCILKKRINKAAERALHLPEPYEHPSVLTAEGIEIRNFITRGEKIYFLDPVQITHASRYEDLARFIASLDILYWGRIDFLLKNYNAKNYSRVFIQAYQAATGFEINEQVLKVYLIKQYLKLWLDGLKVLEFKSYPGPLSQIVQWVYIDRFFSLKIDQLFSSI